LHSLKDIAKYIIILFVKIIFFTSCLKDPCAGVFCFENGECINGTCLCENNYFGQSCDTTYAEYFAGTYVVFDSLNDPADTMLLSVYNSTNSILINDYANLSPNLNVVAIVQNDSTVNIFDQNIIYFDLDSMEQQIDDVAGTILGNLIDTMQLTSSYKNNNDSIVYNKKLLKITN